MKYQYKFNFCKKISIILTMLLSSSMIHAQTFPSPGSQVICGTTTNILTQVTSPDGVSINPSLRLNAPCLDTDLALFSVNSPASFRKPTFCYNNGYFPSSYGNPLAVSRNSTANSGNCDGAKSYVLCDFTQGTAKPNGLSFIVCDVDNPYDTIQVLVYNAGAAISYNYSFMEPNPALSYAFTNAVGTTGNGVHFNGGANGVWGEASATSNWAKGAIQFSVGAGVAVDSVVVTHIIRSNRNDINAAVSIGNFQWTTVTPLSVAMVSFTAEAQNDKTLLTWITASEQHNHGFYIERSADGNQWQPIGFENSKAVDGNSNTTLSYYFTDNSPMTGHNYYRLKQVDKDGKTNYSEVTKAYFAGGATISIFPNPTKDKVAIMGLTGHEKITVYDMTGKVLQQIAAKGNTATLALDGIGTFLLRIIAADGYGEFYKILKEK